MVLHDSIYPHVAALPSFTHSIDNLGVLPSTVPFDRVKDLNLCFGRCRVSDQSGKSLC